MKRRYWGAAASLLMALSLFIPACTPATPTTPTQTTTPATPTTPVTPATPTSETPPIANGHTRSGQAQYGGTLYMGLAADVTTFAGIEGAAAIRSRTLCMRTCGTATG